MPKSQGRKELALSLKPTSWTLALCLATARKFLRNVGSRVSLNRTRADRMMVSASRGAKRSNVCEITCRWKLLAFFWGQGSKGPYGNAQMCVWACSLPLFLCPGGRAKGQGVQSAEPMSSMEWGSGLRTLSLSITLFYRVGLCLELQGRH